jgi:hypothetical protein
MVAVSSVLSPAAGVRKMLVPRWRLRPGTGAKVQRFPSMRVGAEQSRTVVFFYGPSRRVSVLVSMFLQHVVKPVWCPSQALPSDMRTHPVDSAW